MSDETAPRPPRRGYPGAEPTTRCARCGAPLGDDTPRLYWHEDQLVFAYYHQACKPVEYGGPELA